MKLTQDEFKKYWDMLGADKTFSMEVSSGEMFKGFSQLPEDYATCLENNGFV